MVLELIRFSPMKSKRGAAITAAAAAAGPHTGFSADDVRESSLKRSAEMMVEMSVLDLQATVPRVSTAPVSTDAHFSHTVNSEEERGKFSPVLLL